ncbi:MAG TPA: alpha/beta hydrolase [Candidatus Thermoplasmatota archaeon]
MTSSAGGSRDEEAGSGEHEATGHARSWRERVVSWLFLAGAAYAAWALFLFFGQRHMMYPRRGLPTFREAAAEVAGLRTLWLPVGGEEVEAWFLPPRSGEAPRPALLVMHGNAELIDYGARSFGMFAELGVGVMLLEYPGYGRSGGEPTEKSLGEAALAAYDALARQPDVDPARIVPYGRSLGGGPALFLAGVRPVPAVILQSTFTGVRRFARRFLVPGFLVRDRFENARAIRDFEGPVLIFHGRRDEIIPYAHGQALAAAAPDATLVTWECAHNDCPPAWEPHVERVMAFLEEKGILP